MVTLVKICFILGSHWSYTKSGSEYQAEVLIDYLKNKNYRVFYICAGNKYARANINGVEVYALPRRKVLSKLGRPFFFDSSKILGILYDIQPDIIYQRVGFAYTGIAAHYARRNNCRMVWHIASENDVKTHQFEWNRSMLFGYIDKKFLEYGIRNTDYIIGQAEYQDKLLRESYGRKCDLIVPNFHPMPKHEIRKEASSIKVVWVANFKRLKQPEIYIRLAEEFRDCIDVNFVMIGRQGERNWQAELESKIDRLDNLEYLGEKPIDEVNRILCESHIFVNTSIHEGFPNTFIQAWMRKVPVVSLNVDPDDILIENNMGFHSGSFDQMIKDVERLVNDSELREEMGQRAQEYAFENHALEKNVERITRLFEE